MTKKDISQVKPEACNENIDDIPCAVVDFRCQDYDEEESLDESSGKADNEDRQAK